MDNDYQDGWDVGWDFCNDEGRCDSFVLEIFKDYCFLHPGEYSDDWTIGFRDGCESFADDYGDDIFDTYDDYDCDDEDPEY